MTEILKNLSETFGDLCVYMLGINYFLMKFLT